MALTKILRACWMTALVSAPCLAGAADPRVDKVFAAWDTHSTPGCALGVTRRGALIYERGYGIANLELGVPIAPRTVFDIGSVSKHFTAMSILLLAADGKLALDDEIHKFIPELPAYVCHDYACQLPATDRDAQPSIRRQTIVN